MKPMFYFPYSFVYFSENGTLIRFRVFYWNISCSIFAYYYKIITAIEIMAFEKLVSRKNNFENK